MARTKEYEVVVNFTVSWYVTVEAKDRQEAMELAEESAREDFDESFGSLEPSDFYAEAQEIL